MWLRSAGRTGVLVEVGKEGSDVVEESTLVLGADAGKRAEETAALLHRSRQALLWGRRGGE